MFRLLATIFILFITASVATEETYVFEAKGEFAKELKALVEKYSKEGKIDAKVYIKDSTTAKEKIQTRTQAILSAFTSTTAEELKHADIQIGEKLYQKSCATCHGKKADDSKYATARDLITLNPLTIVELLEGYRLNYEGDFGGSARFIMKPQADNLTYKEMQSIAVYIHSLKNNTIPKTSTQPKKSDKTPTSYLQ